MDFEEKKEFLCNTSKVYFDGTPYWYQDENGTFTGDKMN